MSTTGGSDSVRPLDIIVEYRSGTSHAAQGKPWVMVARCPDGCNCDSNGEQTVISGFATAFDAIAWRDKMRADIAAGKHRRDPEGKPAQADAPRETTP